MFVRACRSSLLEWIAQRCPWRYEGITAEDMTKTTLLKPNGCRPKFAFTEWTAEALLRHAGDGDLRPDVQARPVRRERA
jgi:hypothetical protein